MRTTEEYIAVHLQNLSCIPLLSFRNVMSFRNKKPHGYYHYRDVSDLHDLNGWRTTLLLRRPKTGKNEHTVSKLTILQSRTFETYL